MKAMELITIANVKLYFGDRLILDIPNLKIHKGDRIGIVGANGSGKSTLLNLLSGSVQCDAGVIHVNGTIAYCRQFFKNTPYVADTVKQKKNGMKFGVIDSENHSGGEKQRVQLSEIFSNNADIYFLDEPTSNLDYKGILLLKDELAKRNTFLLVSHDRALLNECCNKIIEISDATLILYEGNYAAYEYQKKLHADRKAFEYNQYIKEKKRLQTEYIEKSAKAKRIAKKPKDRGQRIGKECGTKSFSSKAKNMEKSAKAALKKIEMLEQKEKPKEDPAIKIDFRLTNPPKNKYVIQIDNLCYGYDSKILFDHLNLSIRNGEKVAILGDNGAGKTTLLNLIVNGHPSIRTVPGAVFGYVGQHYEQLDLSKTVLENAMHDAVQNTQTVRTILARLLFDERSLNRKANVLSGGERVRLSMAKLLVSNANMLILDEPTNYLDLNSRKAVEKVLQDYMGTILFVSHDITFVDAIASRRLLLSGQKIQDYEEK